VNILLLSSGGGGGNILRSLKALFRRDLLVTQKIDSKYAERLRRAVTTRFLDTNEFSLSDVPEEERLVIGAETTRRLGSRHNPDLARQAFEESRDEVEAAIRGHSVIVIIGTGGKGTGAGTIFPLAEMGRRLKKLVVPIFVRPSFERHEVEKRRYDHALKVTQQFDAKGIRLIEVLNDRGILRRRSGGTDARVGADEPANRARIARPALRALGSVPGRPVRSVDTLCRQRQAADRLL
jgi:cell division GTPase FtsZ